LKITGTPLPEEAARKRRRAFYPGTFPPEAMSRGWSFIRRTCLMPDPGQGYVGYLPETNFLVNRWHLIVAAFDAKAGISIGLARNSASMSPVPQMGYSGSW